MRVEWKTLLVSNWLPTHVCVCLVVIQGPLEGRYINRYRQKLVSKSLNQYKPPGIQMLPHYFEKKQAYRKFKSLAQEIRITTWFSLFLTLSLSVSVTLTCSAYHWHTSGVSLSKFWSILGARKVNIAEENESSSWTLITDSGG
jgi:hypothetical protein